MHTTQSYKLDYPALSYCTVIHCIVSVALGKSMVYFQVRMHTRRPVYLYGIIWLNDTQVLLLSFGGGCGNPYGVTMILLATMEWIDPRGAHVR